MGESLYDLHELNQLVIRAKIHSSSYPLQSINSLNYWGGDVSHTHAQPRFHGSLNLESLVYKLRSFSTILDSIGPPYSLIGLNLRPLVYKLRSFSTELDPVGSPYSLIDLAIRKSER